MFVHWVFLSSVPGSGQLGAFLCGHGRGEQLSWGSFGESPAAGRPGALEERATWIDYILITVTKNLTKNLTKLVLFVV